MSRRCRRRGRRSAARTRSAPPWTSAPSPWISSWTATAAFKPPAPMSPPQSDFSQTNAMPANPPLVGAVLRHECRAADVLLEYGRAVVVDEVLVGRERSELAEVGEKPVGAGIADVEAPGTRQADEADVELAERRRAAREGEQVEAERSRRILAAPPGVHRGRRRSRSWAQALRTGRRDRPGSRTSRAPAAGTRGRRPACDRRRSAAPRRTSRPRHGQ